MKIRKLAAVSSILALSIGLALPAGAVDIPDEQLKTPRPPVENVGGYSGAYYDDQRTLNRAFSYVEAWKGSYFEDGSYTTCKSAEDEPCKSSNFVTFQTQLSPCNEIRIRDCVSGFSVRLNGSSEIQASLVELTETALNGFGTIQKLRYANTFKGDQKRGIPDSGKVSVWKFPGVKHVGGDEFLLIPMLSVITQGLDGGKPSNLDVGVFAVSRLPAAGKNEADCFFLTTSTCFVRWALPSDATFSTSIKTGSKLIGWFYGRIDSPDINSEKMSDGQTQVTISGSPMTIPTVAVWAKNTELPPALEAMLEKEFVDRNYQFAGRAFFGGIGVKDRSKLAVIDEINQAFTDSLFERYLLWVKVANDKAYANVSTWSFRTMEDYRADQGFEQYGKCIGDSGVAGMVTTNSNAYIAGPPKFTDGDLAYKVASPHYDSKGALQIGTYDLAIRSDVARCLYGFTSAPIQASLSVIYADGEAKKATTLVSEKNNWLRLSAKGFTYSSPTVKVRLTQEKAVVAPSPTPSASPTPTQMASASAAPVAAKKTSITCVKGKTTKKVTAVNPKCPTGFKRK
jgi:hypothetical protein